MRDSIFILQRRFKRDDGDWSEPVFEDRYVCFTGPETDWMPTIHPILKRPFEERWVELVPKSELAEARASAEGKARARIAELRDALACIAGSAPAEDLEDGDLQDALEWAQALAETTLEADDLAQSDEPNPLPGAEGDLRTLLSVIEYPLREALAAAQRNNSEHAEGAALAAINYAETLALKLPPLPPAPKASGR